MMPYERLRAWQKCHELVLAVYRCTKLWPKEEIYGLTSQVRRATYSAAANIVEGAAKRGVNEYRRFLDMAVASLHEVSYILRIAKDLGLGAREDLVQLEELRESAGKLTWRLYEAVGKRSPQQRKATR